MCFWILNLCHLVFMGWPLSWVDPCFKSSDLITSHLISAIVISSHTPHVISSDVTSHLLIPFSLLSCHFISPLLTLGKSLLYLPFNLRPFQLDDAAAFSMRTSTDQLDIDCLRVRNNARSQSLAATSASSKRLRIQCASSIVRLVVSKAMRQQRTFRTPQTARNSVLVAGQDVDTKQAFTQKTSFTENPLHKEAFTHSEFFT